MNPDMMRQAMEMMKNMPQDQLQQMMGQMSSMSPDMIAQAQRMAANMTPEDMERARAAMGSMTPEQISQQASQAKGHYEAQQKYVLTVSDHACSTPARPHTCQKSFNFVHSRRQCKVVVCCSLFVPCCVYTGQSAAQNRGQHAPLVWKVPGSHHQVHTRQGQRGELRGDRGGAAAQGLRAQPELVLPQHARMVPVY